MPEISLNLGEIVELKLQELGGEESEFTDKLRQCIISVNHRLQFCEYHYSVLKEVVTPQNLAFEKLGTFHRAGDSVSVRIVYEANIVTFIQNLHALLDSFPYMLNLFFKVYDDPELKHINWSKQFLDEYQGKSFSGELHDFFIKKEFHRLKTHTNDMKHKKLLLVRNEWSHLELETFPQNEKVMEYLTNCHDKLIPHYFALWESLKLAKRIELSSSACSSPLFTKS